MHQIVSVSDRKWRSSIGEDRFEDCTSLTSSRFPRYTSMGEKRFGAATSLTGVTIPNSVTIIGASAFVYASVDQRDYGTASHSSVCILFSPPNILARAYFTGKAPPLMVLPAYSYNDPSDRSIIWPATTGGFWSNTYDIRLSRLCCGTRWLQNKCANFG